MDKEFTQICKEILGISKKLEKIEPDELKKIKTDIERISEAVAADKTLFDTDKKDFDGKYNKIAEIIKTFDTLKAQIEEVLKSGVINDSTEALISTFSSKKIMDLLNEAKGAVDEKFSTIYKNGITPWSSSLDYPAGAISVLNGKLYQARTQNINKEPSENKEEWRVLASEEWCEQTFLNKDEKIDSYSKTESDKKFVLKTELQDGTPIGAYLAWSSQEKIPAGYLLCDGRSLKKSEYNELFAVIGYTYGGSGENFNIPKFNDGRFFRSIGGNAAALGIAQGDAIDVNSLQLNSYTGDNAGARHTYGTNSTVEYRAVAFTYSNNGEDLGYKSSAGKGNATIFSSTKKANENRPYNMSVVVLIKAKDVKEPSANQIDKNIYATEVKAGITKLKNAITGEQEDVAVTEKAVSKALKAQLPLGAEQTWQDMTSQRQKDIVYTNTTDRPICVVICGAVNYHSAPATVLVNNIQIGYLISHAGVYNLGQVNFCVPVGSSYKVNSDGTDGIDIFKWLELR